MAAEEQDGNAKNPFRLHRLAGWQEVLLVDDHYVESATDWHSGCRVLVEDGPLGAVVPHADWDRFIALGGVSWLQLCVTSRMALASPLHRGLSIVVIWAAGVGRGGARWMKTGVPVPTLHR